MRISGGKARGIPLRAGKAPGLRPATESNRERLFSSLGELVVAAKVLDLFAGTGSYGLEALSRGASNAVFVERNRTVSKNLKANLGNVLKSAQLEKNAAQVIVRDVMDFLRSRPPAPYDLIFLDPPYTDISVLRDQLFKRLIENQFAHPNSLLMHECPLGETENPIGWERLKTLGKGGKGSPIFHIFQIAD
jgi:16S rRNA (guanine966-N2)-methyltransferase